jgi:hypothetical protein
LVVLEVNTIKNLTKLLIFGKHTLKLKFSLNFSLFLQNLENYSDFVRYNRVLFVITGKIYHKNDLNQPNKYFCLL